MAFAVFGGLGLSAQTPRTPLQLVQAMLVQEQAPHLDRYEYMVNERSDRTGGRLWTERVVETQAGTVRMLLAEDGKPLTSERAKAERERLSAIAAHPEEFARRERAQKDDEAHARELLEQLPKGFLLDNVRLADGVWKMDFRPNPDYAPSGMEERVLHAMSGWIAIDAHDLRMTHIEGHLPQDYNVGFGLLASIKAGSCFESDRSLIAGHWRTVHVATDVRGRAALFKTVARKSDVTRSEFRYIEENLPVTEAVALLSR